MRKLFYAVVALSLFATSCAKDEAAAPEATAKTKTVTFSVNAPEMQTRATGDGTQANKLYYAFYDQDGLVAGISDVDGVEFTGTKTITATLVKDRSYTGIFWAQNDASGYKVNFTQKLAEANVAMNYDNKEVANSENYDGFWAGFDNIQNMSGQTLRMYRPFAQLNIGVTAADIENASKAGVDVASVQAVVGEVPTTFKLYDGKVEGEATVTFDWVAKGNASTKLGDPAVDYTIYSTNYVLVGACWKATEKQLVSVTFNISEEEAGDAAAAGDNLTRDFGNAVPVQANYRTFILGNILTGFLTDCNWTVQIYPTFVIGQDNVVDADTI